MLQWKISYIVTVNLETLNVEFCALSYVIELFVTSSAKPNKHGALHIQQLILINNDWPHAGLKGANYVFNV